jgi:hypothetical protein
MYLCIRSPAIPATEPRPQLPTPGREMDPGDGTDGGRLNLRQGSVGLVRTEATFVDDQIASTGPRAVFCAVSMRKCIASYLPSKHSCGLSLIAFQQPAEPFPTPNWASLRGS